MIGLTTVPDPIDNGLCLSPETLALSPIIELAALVNTANLLIEEEKKPFIVLFNGIPHDIGSFIYDHPGGPDIIQGIKEGTEISEIMADKSVHSHSQFAYKMLASMKQEQRSNVSTENFSFLDLSQPLVWQILSPSSKITKAEYLNGIHIPQFLNHSARLFESDILESLSKTVWWVIPLIWIPISLLAFYVGHSCSYTQNLLISLGLFLLGFGSWSLLEYLIHRFLFHLDATPMLPDNRYFLTAHFFLHGIHHFMPLDPYRLVMPPAMTVILGTLFWGLFSIFISSLSAKLLLFSGLLLGYVWYDLTHYHLHHYYNNHTLNIFMGSQDFLRKKHNGHHYKTPDKGFGVSSSLWDIIFNTMQ